MNHETTDLMRGELERLFDLEEMQSLSEELMGYDPTSFAGHEGSIAKGAFARALVEKAAADEALEALADAVRLLGKSSADITRVFDVRVGDEPVPGSKVGEFVIRKKLGEGGIGKVFLGERGEGDERVRVAIKIVRSSLSRDRSAVARYLTSQRAFQRSGAAGVGVIRGCGTLEDGRPWVATDFLEGQTLAARIERVGPMHFNEARPIFTGLLRALQATHEAGLFHSDVKTGNIFVTRPVFDDGSRGEPTGVAIDGGAYRLLAAGAASPDSIGALRMFGNAHAISPEMARGEAVGVSGDIYAAGVALYEALSGRKPFEGSSAFDVIAQHLERSADPPSTHAPKGWIDKGLDALVIKSLAKDPAERFQSAGEFCDAIEALAKSKEKKEALDERAFERAKTELLSAPGSRDAATSLEEIASPAGAWEMAIAVLREAMGNAKSDDDKTDLLLRVARIQDAELSDRVAAGATYREVREIDEGNAIALSGLEEICRRGGDHDGLAELLLERVERVESTTERAAVLREIGELYEDELKDDENALVAWTQALSDEPRDKKTQRAIERLASSDANRWNEVLGSLNEAAADPADPSDAVILYVLMGRWYANAVQRPDFALPCFAQALQLDPSADDAYEGLTALYTKVQSWQELAQLLQNRADAANNPAVARDYRAEAGDVILRKLSDQDAAMTLFQSVLQDDPTHPKALDAIASLHEARGEWVELAEFLRQRVRQSSGGRKVVAHLQLGEIYEDRLDDFEKGSEQYEAALALDARNVDALKGLERIYARRNDYPKLLEVLTKQLDVVATPRQKIALFEHIGAIQEEEFVDHGAATESYEAVVAIDGSHESANVALARLYRSQGKHDELVRTLERHAAATEDQVRKAELLLRAARALMKEVGAPERALAICERVLVDEPKNVEALGLSARITAESGDTTAAVAVVDRLAEFASGTDRAGHYIEAGRLLEEAGDKDRAIERYKYALEADTSSTVASDALHRLYASRGDAQGAADLLRGELERSTSDLRKAKLQAELGNLYFHRLKDKVRAKEAFEAALALDGSSFEAARGLGDMAYEDGDAAGAAVLYEPLLSHTGDLEKEEALEICLRTGDAFCDAGELGKAQRAYLNARAFAPKDRSVLEKVADVAFEAGEADEAAGLYAELLEEFSHEIRGAERGRMLFRQGEALRRSGELVDAEALLKEAAKLLPDETRTLEALGQVQLAKGDFQGYITMSRQRMEHLDDDARFALLASIGDVQLEKLEDRQKAAKSYVEALEIVPDDRNLLTKLMGVYSESRDWSRLVEVILRIAELVSDAGQLSKYYLTAAAISHRELKRSGEAADYYAQALDHNPGLNKAFDGLVETLTDEGSWSKLAQAYETRISWRASAPAEERAALHDALGALYTDRVGDAAKAAEAYETAHELDSDSRARLESLVVIYEQNPKRFFRKAINAHGAILRLSPYRVESYQALRKIYSDRNLKDEEWCVCQSLKALGMAGPDEESFYKAHKPEHPAAAQEFFGEDIWFNHLIHPDQDPLLTDIFAAITPAAVKVSGKGLGAYGLDGQKPRDVLHDGSEMVKTLAYAAGVTQIALPPIYYRESDPGGLSVIFTESPGVLDVALGVGKGALAGGPPQALAFVASRQLTYFRSGLLMRTLAGRGSALRAWLLGAIRVVNPSFHIPPKLTKKVENRAASLKQFMDRAVQEKLGSLVQKLLSAAPELDMKKWIAAADLTADRVGFVMANSLELAAAVIKASPADLMPQKERLQSLYLYSASPAYMQLRRKIGVSIDA